MELVQASRSPTVISVALQLPASEKSVRLTQKFASNTSLWEILRQFESGEGNYNFTQRGVPEISGKGSSGAGRLNYEMPVITVMPAHREHSEFVGLQKTLSQLGFDSGSALLRLSFKNSGTPLEEAMAQISQYFKSSEPAASGAHSASSAQTTSMPDPEKAAPEATETVAGETARTEEPETEPESEPMQVDAKPAEEPAPEPNFSQEKAPETVENELPSTSAASNGARDVQIFSAPTSNTPQAARGTWNEGDYVPTIEHAKAHQAALQNRTRNQRLLSDKELADQEAARLEKLNAVAEKGGSLRVRMPDGTFVQMKISKDDTTDILYDSVRNVLERKDEPFQLKYVGPNGRLVLIPYDNKKRLIQDLRFSNMEMVTFLWDEGASNEARTSRKALAKEWQAKAQTLKVEEPVVEDKAEPAAAESKAEGKRKAGMSSGDKESKLKSILGKGLFKR